MHKIQLNIFFILITFSFLTNAEVPTQNTISSIKVNKVTFDDVEVDMVYYYAGDSNNISLSMSIPGISGLHRPNRIVSGFNNLRFYVPRDRNRHAKASSSIARIKLHKNYKKIIWEEEVELNIDWPGPEYIQNIIYGESIKHNDFSSIRLITVEKIIDPEGNIYKNMLLNGAPIHKVKRLGSRGTGFTHAKVTIGNQVSLDIAKLVVSETLKEIKYISKIVIGNNKVTRFGENDIHISFGSMKYALDEKIIKQIVLTGTIDDFYKLVGHKRISQKDDIENKYKLAYKLIDSGIKNNLYRAKSILDEIISTDPNYPRAYLELARFNMKTSKDFKNDGLNKAERSILIAKRIDPNLSDTRVLLGYVYTNQRKFKKAQKEYEKAMQLGSDNLWLQANWGLNYQMQDRNKKAIEMYTQVINKKRKHNKNDRPMLWVKGYIFPLLIDAGKYKLADDYYNKFITNFPEKNCTLLEQSNLRLFYLNDYKAAIESHLKATRKGCKRYSSTLSLSYYAKWHENKKQNKNKKAEIAFNQAEGLALSDTVLFRDLSKSSYLSKLIAPIHKAGRDINAEDSKGFNALMHLIYNKELDSVDRLLLNGADINYESKSIKITPIMSAVFTGDIKVVKHILKYKPDLSKMLPTGQTLSEWAISQGLIEISNIVSKKQKA